MSPVSYEPVVVTVPIADRQTSYAFYRDALGLEAFGELGDDGVPEPLQFILNAGVRLMLVPRVGFGWIIGGKGVTSPGDHECLLAIGVSTQADTAALIARAVSAGADLITSPDHQPWGYAGAFADPDGHIWMVRTDEATTG